VIIAVVSFANSYSMAKLIARKHTYDVRPNQELIALVGTTFL
jgi:MFS superfamily sulfate permease-like transporter